MRVASALACLACLACGPAPSDGTTAVESDELPPNDRDPPPYVPAPSDDATTGAAVGIATSGGFEQARAMTIRVVEAVRDGDQQTLEEQLADVVGRTRPRLASPHVPRSQYVAQLVDPRRRRFTPGPDAVVEQLVDVNAIEVLPLAQHEDAAELPDGFFPTDLLVTIPVRDQGRRFLGVTLQWMAEGRLVVRPGGDPRIVAL